MDDHEIPASGLDWRIALGLTVTTVWMGGGLVYLTSVVGWENFLSLPTADIGSFFEGAFAPLAFLWLVIGHFMQQKEITANTRAMSMQERTTRRLEMHSRRDSYFKLLSLVQDQLGNIAAFHYVSVFGPSGTEDVSMEEFSSLRSQASTGDHALFVRRMISEVVDRREDPDAVREILFGTEIRERHSNNFCVIFERLLKAAVAVDENGMVRDALMEGSAAGLFYRIIRYSSGDESMNPISGQRLFGVCLTPSPMLLPDYAWPEALRKAIKRNRRDAHNRYLQLGTLRADGSPAVRTLVFRDLREESGELRMVTDARSAKTDEIAVDPRAEAAWYFSHTREQFRLRGDLGLQGPQTPDQTVREATWEALSEASRAQFFWPHPGRPVASTAPVRLSADVPETFLVLALRVTGVDHLSLRGDPQTRVRSFRDDTGAWVSEAINP